MRRRGIGGGGEEDSGGSAGEGNGRWRWTDGDGGGGEEGGCGGLGGDFRFHSSAQRHHVVIT